MNKSFKRKANTSILATLIVNLTIGTWSVVEILSWFSIKVPLIACIVIGIFAGTVSIPVAIVGWVLKICGVF